MKKMQDINFTIADNEESLDKSVSVGFQNMSLKSLKYFFSSAILNQFDKHKIDNLEQLFEIESTPDFMTFFGSTKIYSELNNTIRLLKCKYLNEKPMIDISNQQMHISEVYTLLGFSARTKHCLLRDGFSVSAKDFFEKIRKPQIFEDLDRIQNLGQYGVNEIMQKTGIVINYFDNIKTTEEHISITNESDTLKLLIVELQRLREERKKVDERIDLILTKIQEKESLNSKGRTIK